MTTESKADLSSRSHGPTGVKILKKLSRALGYDVKIWEAEKLVKTILCPKNCDSRKIEVEFIPESGKYGQWILKKADSKYSKFCGNCLLNVLKTHPNIDTVRFGQYHGYSASYAGLVLDRSHGATSDSEDRHKGYPRAYAVCDYDSNYRTRNVADCVQKYSTISPHCQINAFLSYRQQNRLAHAALRSRPVQGAITKLNQPGCAQVRFRIPPKTLGYSKEEMPFGCVWQNGKRGISDIQITEIYMELRHHLGKRGDPDAEVMVFIMYPLLKNIPELQNPRFFQKVKTGTPKYSKSEKSMPKLAKKPPRPK